MSPSWDSRWRPKFCC